MLRYKYIDSLVMNVTTFLLFERADRQLLNEIMHSRLSIFLFQEI